MADDDDSAAPQFGLAPGPGEDNANFPSQAGIDAATAAAAQKQAIGARIKADTDWARTFARQRGPN